MSLAIYVLAPNCREPRRPERNVARVHGPTREALLAPCEAAYSAAVVTPERSGGVSIFSAEGRHNGRCVWEGFGIPESQWPNGRKSPADLAPDATPWSPSASRPKCSARSPRSPTRSMLIAQRLYAGY